MKKIIPLNAAEISELMKNKNINLKQKEDGMPDLVLANLTASQVAPAPGTTVFFDVVVINNGKKDSGIFTVEVDSGYRQDETKIKNLKPNEGVYIPDAGYLVTDPPPIHRYYNVIATADSKKEVKESNESNNVASVLIMT